MTTIRSIFLLFCIAIYCSCKPQTSENINNKLSADQESRISGTFSISGAYALYPLAKKWADDFMAIHPGVKIDIKSSGTGGGIEDIKDSTCQLALLSRPLTDEELNTGIWYVPVAKDGVAPIVNQNNPHIEKIMKQGLSPEEFLKAFTSVKPLSWGELLNDGSKEKVTVFIRGEESGAAYVFAEFLFKESFELKGIKVESENEMIKRVQDNPLSIGFCNFTYAFDIKTGDRVKDIQIVPSDLDFDNRIDRREAPFSNLEKVHRGLWLGLYPKNLCRELSIGSLGKPTNPLVIEFIKYALTEGQNNIKESGLCELNDVYVRNGLEKLN